jgi:uncharacterized membrane protein YqaE (UPF0057 family)
MNKLNYTLGLIALMTIFASCSVEKRVHRNGYHVEWHGRNKQVDQTTAIAEQKDVTPSENEPKTQSEVQDVALAPIAAVNAERPLEKEKETKSDDANNAPTKRQVRKQMMQSLTGPTKANPWSGHKAQVSHAMDAAETGSQVDQLVCVIVALFLPFLGVYLYQGDITQDFWIALILSLLFYFPGLLYALYVILMR